MGQPLNSFEIQFQDLIIINTVFVCACVCLVMQLPNNPSNEIFPLTSILNLINSDAHHFLCVLLYSRKSKGASRHFLFIHPTLFTQYPPVYLFTFLNHSLSVLFYIYFFVYLFSLLILHCV